MGNCDKTVFFKAALRVSLDIAIPTNHCRSLRAPPPPSSPLSQYRRSHKTMLYDQYHTTVMFLYKALTKAHVMTHTLCYFDCMMRSV